METAGQEGVKTIVDGDSFWVQITASQFVVVSVLMAMDEAHLIDVSSAVAGLGDSGIVNGRKTLCLSDRNRESSPLTCQRRC